MLTPTLNFLKSSEILLFRAVLFITSFFKQTSLPFPLPHNFPNNFTYQVPAAIELTSKSLLVAGFINRNVNAMQEPV